MLYFYKILGLLLREMGPFFVGKFFICCRALGLGLERAPGWRELDYEFSLNSPWYADKFWTLIVRFVWIYEGSSTRSICIVVYFFGESGMDQSFFPLKFVICTRRKSIFLQINPRRVHQKSFFINAHWLLLYTFYYFL